MMFYFLKGYYLLFVCVCVCVWGGETIRGNTVHVAIAPKPEFVFFPIFLNDLNFYLPAYNT